MQDYKTLAIALALLFMFQSANAFYSYPIFSGFQGNCTQVNSTFINCMDGVPVPVTFTVSARYAPYYGNFSLYSATPSNVTEPIGMNGKPCIVPSTSTVTCMATLSPIPITFGNGIIKKTFTMLLVSSNYPQVTFESSFNITIAHNLTPFQQSLLNLYNSSYSNFTSMYVEYLYFCNTYGICSTSLAANISAANSIFENASLLINDSDLSLAYQNLTLANSLMRQIYVAFPRFLNNSNAIVNNLLKAKGILASMQNAYVQNETKLSQCRLPNGTTYSEAINSTISKLGDAKPIATFNASKAYLSEVAAAQRNESALIGSCMPAPKVASISFKLPKGYTFYIVIAFVALLAIYSISKLLEIKSIRAIRSSSNEPVSLVPEGIANEEKEEKAEEGEDLERAPSKKESKEGTKPHMSLEEEFDNWLSNILGKQQPDKKSEGKAKPRGQK